MPTGWESSCLKSRQGKKTKESSGENWSLKPFARQKTVFFPLFCRKNSSRICWRALKEWLRNLLWQTETSSVTSSTAARAFFFSQIQNVTSTSTPTQRSAPSCNSSYVNIYLVTIMMFPGFHSFQSLFEDIFKIFDTITWLLGSQSTESFIIKHSMGTIYQSRWGSHKALFHFSFDRKWAVSNLVGICSVLYSHTVPSLGNAVLGSQRDGEYIKLPSDSAMASQIKRHRRITSQVCVFHHFTLIHADIHRNVSSS